MNPASRRSRLARYARDIATLPGDAAAGYRNEGMRGVWNAVACRTVHRVIRTSRFTVFAQRLAHLPAVATPAGVTISRLGSEKVEAMAPIVKGMKDEEIARMIRYGVKPNGQAALPFMPYAELSDDDLTAIISYLRTQKPVRHEVADHDVNPLGRVVQAFVLQPKGPSHTPPKSFPAAATPEYGKYITHSIGNCVMCHTQVDLRTGAFSGPLFGGGAEHEAVGNPSKKYVTPNLTPDARWGWLSGWDEEAFVARFKAGRVHADSPMPWEAFQHMTDTDLRAVYRYFKTLAPAQTGPDPKKHEVILTASNP